MNKEEQKAFEEGKAKATIANLEKEKAGYKARDLPDRVKAVDAEITRIKKDGRVTPAPKVAAKADTEES